MWSKYAIPGALEMMEWSIAMHQPSFHSPIPILIDYNIPEFTPY